MNEEIIARNARLPTVRESALRDSKRSIFNIRIGIDNRWAFSSEFENARHEIFSCSFSNKSSLVMLVEYANKNGIRVMLIIERN